MKNKVTSGATVGLRNKSFSWQQYLEQENASAAPQEVFTQYQCGSSRRSCGFKVGMKLEGVDPLHPSMFCVLSVAEVIGCRLRLHIDGFSESYDFWVNADSPEMRPTGFCRETGLRLHPPKGEQEQTFDWSEYLQRGGAEAAPASLFRTSTSAPCGLKRGMKLEAVDRKNPALVCVASVSDVIDERIRVHFDDWDDSYDYWCDSHSPFVHPVGWCQEQGRPLTSPRGHPDPEHFVWEKYLQQTNSEAAPSEAFSQSTPHGFQVNHRLEAVDRRNPVLIRVSTVVQTQDLRIRVHYDGWSVVMDAWFDCDDPDLHPVGWCQRTGHRLEPPRGFSSDSSPSVCPTVGCRGVGHIRGPKYSHHHSLFGCPYSETNLRKDLVLPDRLGPETGLSLLPHRSEIAPLKKRKLSQSRVCEVSPAVIKQEEAELNTGPDPVLVQSRFLSALSPQPNRDLILCWDQHRKLLPSVKRDEGPRVQDWTVQQVSEFIQSLPGCEDQAQHFRDQEIDGRAFLLLTQRDIVRILSIKLGPALKIYHCIMMFRHERSQSQRSTTGIGQSGLSATGTGQSGLSATGNGQSGLSATGNGQSGLSATGKGLSELNTTGNGQSELSATGNVQSERSVEETNQTEHT